MNEALEYLLKDLGWKPTIKAKGVIDARWYNPNEPNTWVDADKPTYDFISQIPIEDWGIYKKHLARILGINESVGYWVDVDDEAFHNALLDHRILALALARGFHE